METPNYTARVIEFGDVAGYIDIQPSIGTISEDFLGDFGADSNTTVKHKLTTAHTTRLSVAINNEELPVADRLKAFQDTAKYILEVLVGTDRGLDDSGMTPRHTIVLNSDEL